VTRPSASVVIINHNYGHFLPQAIESALGQTSPPMQVIVVDDGSTDHSTTVAQRYGERIDLVRKENGGMASAFNAGFARVRGDVVFPLDADDVLLPHAVEDGTKGFREESAVRVQWPVQEVDRSLRPTGRLVPQAELPDGDLVEAVLDLGPMAFPHPALNGCAWRRTFLARIMPIPEGTFRQHSDVYLNALAPLYGTSRSLREPRALYRVHGDNDYATLTRAEKTDRLLSIYRLRCHLIEAHLLRLGYRPDPGRWFDGNPHYDWLQELRRGAQEIAAAIPEGETYALIDQDEWAGGEQFIAGRPNVAFPERDGFYWGPPASDEELRQALAHAETRGIRRAVIALPAFWWLDHYPTLARLARRGDSVRSDLTLTVDLTAAFERA
jgi:glycosyltransferase involved in cell wall biosynthesis